jgi:hypothetical protein
MFGARVAETTCERLLSASDDIIYIKGQSDTASIFLVILQVQANLGSIHKPLPGIVLETVDSTTLNYT